MSSDEFKVDGKLSATAIAASIAEYPTPLGRGVEGDLYEYRDGVFIRDENVTRRRVARALGDHHSSTVLGQVSDHLLNIELPAVGLPELPRGYLDYIVLENGIYWWRDDVLEAHTPALGALTKLPIEYDPIAIPHAFSEWLGQVLGGDADLERHMWEVIGYLLMTGNPLQVIVLLYGKGGNGKGAFSRVLREMLGRANYSSISLHQLVEDRFASAGLYGKIANISGDLSSKFLTDPQILKEITGGDSISASRKFGQSFEFVPYAVPVFASNEYFRTSDTSDGWRRRWMVIEFAVPVKELADRGEIRHLDEQQLFEDIPGIFNIAMDGLRRLMDRGRFDPPRAALDATQRLHDDADPFMLWLDDDEHVFRGPDEQSPRGDVYRKYQAWCRRNGYTAMASGPLGRRLAAIGIDSYRPGTGAGRVWYYRGISVMLGTADA